DEARAETQMVGGLTREQFGRQFLNRKQFEVWQSQGQTLQFASWAEIPLETQILSSADFRAAVLVSSPLPRPQSTERP
ncbi:MAG: hypothetical protein HC933_21685, partial [Pleurocapsa sp. SU_196_0]|nr:hypothetical protein [Pleurocapsa sp. SU_196_0]